MSFSQKLILGILQRLQFGQLTVILPSGEVHTFTGGQHAAGQTPSPIADVQFKNTEVFGKVLKGGDIAFAEAFMAGEVHTSNLTELLKLFVANRAVIDRALYGSWWGVLLDKIRHWTRRNTKTQARKNIAAHYDLGNDFYKLWLDESWTYSSAIFDAPPSTVANDSAALYAAQQRKYARVLQELGGAQNILEIGCGWGGFAQAAAEQSKRTSGLTLSTEQLAFARVRLEQLNFAVAAEFKLQDYRDEGLNQPGQYDGIASIEMFEAVGQAYWPSYFECIARNLKTGGKACVQSIVIADALFERYAQGTDFIQRYIFPGGMLPSISIFERMAQQAGLRLVRRFAFGADYARTLAVWHLRFNAALPQVRALGYSESFIRMWQFYLAYCEAGFVGGDIDVVQFTLAKA